MTCTACEDIAWLIDSGERHQASIARRVLSDPGTSDQRAAETLRRHLRLHNRTDLIRRLEIAQ